MRGEDFASVRGGAGRAVVRVGLAEAKNTCAFPNMACGIHQWRCICDTYASSVWPGERAQATAGEVGLRGALCDVDPDPGRQR